MDRKRLEDQLAIDEGRKNEVYRDTLGFLTVGIGHKVTPVDNLHDNDQVSDERIDALFSADLDAAITYVEKYIPSSYNDQPEAVQEALINMCFNLGIGNLMKFPHFLADLAARNYEAAAHELETSLWYRQVGDRAKRIVTAVRSAGVPSDSAWQPEAA
jgi:lysozyme